MMTLAVLLSLCADVTVKQSVTIESDASIERLVAEAAVQLLPVAWDRFADSRRLPGKFRPNVRDAWYDVGPEGLAYGYTATIANRVVRRSTTLRLHHVYTSATLLSGLPQYCQSATLSLDARELPTGRTRLILTLTLRLHHPAEWCRWVRRGMCKQGNAEAAEKLQQIAAAGREAILSGRGVLTAVETALARRTSTRTSRR